MQLMSTDLHHVLVHTPGDVRLLVKDKGLLIGGGFIRAIIGDERPSDIDLFGPNKDYLQTCADELVASRKRNEGPFSCRYFRTNNAITVLSKTRMPIQFIKRWTYDEAESLINDFDFTVCQAAIWWNVEANQWDSLVGARFYQDLANKRLFYCTPLREEDAGGSMMRVIKYIKRGYGIQPESLAKVIERLIEGIDFETNIAEEAPWRIIASLLREVDPLRIIDGVELRDDHTGEDMEALGIKKDDK